MSARSSSLSAESRSLTDEITLDKTLNCLLEHLPLEMTGAYDRQHLFSVLLKAASDRGESCLSTMFSIEDDALLSAASH